MILRRATLDDAGAIARLHRHTVRTSLAFLPELHSPEDDLWFFRERLMVECETWVAEIDGVIAGYTAFKPEWLMHLYVHPDRQGAGVGAALHDKALQDGAPRQLWAFQQNTRARRFYEARGWRLVKLTDGAENEEKMPDALYAWPGRVV